MGRLGGYFLACAIFSVFPQSLCELFRGVWGRSKHKKNMQFLPRLTKNMQKYANAFTPTKILSQKKGVKIDVLTCEGE